MRNENKIARMKTIKQCFDEIKKLDSETAVTQWFIRCLAKEGKVKHFMSGSKVLINYDDLLRFLNFECNELQIENGGLIENEQE